MSYLRDAHRGTRWQGKRNEFVYERYDMNAHGSDVVPKLWTARMGEREHTEMIWPYKEDGEQ